MIAVGSSLTHNLCLHLEEKVYICKLYLILQSAMFLKLPESDLKFDQSN